MVDYDILDSYGTNRDMIRAVFTAKSDKITPHAEKILNKRKAALLETKVKPDDAPDNWEPKLTPKEIKALTWKTVNGLWKTREAWRKKICTRIEEGLVHNVRHFRFYTAADMAMDSTPIHAEAIPLNLYAQGKINFGDCVDRLSDCCKGDKQKLEQFLVKDPKDPQKVVGIDLPRLHHVIVNIVRPLITRRLAAQANKFNNLWPYLKYDTRDKKPVSKLRGDVMSQRAEVMSDNYGYRHLFTQAMRKSLLHGHALAFPESAWDKEFEFRKKMKGGDDAGWEAEKVLVKEGINFILPHPNRRFYDLQYSPSTFNTDSGCRYAGFWDVDRLRNLLGNNMYYNTSEVRVSERFINRFVTNQEFNSCNFSRKTISLKPRHLIRHDQKNDRSTTYWIDAKNSGDTEVVVTTYYEKIIPKDEGLGDYPFPVWIRLLVVDDDTVIFGEIMPSRPCLYLGYNEDDSRVIAQSMAHEIIPYQDHMTNLFSQMLYLMKLQSFLLLMVDVDMLSETHREQFKELVKGNQYFAKPLLVEHSSTDFRETFGKNPDNPVKFVIPQIQAQINELLRGVSEILAMAERNQIMSPQELGQFNQRETSATEVASVESTTNAVFSFISEGADDFRAALKQMIYESTVAKGSKTIKVPVINTYDEKVVQAAGFEIDRTDEVDLNADAQGDDGAPPTEVLKSETGAANKQALQRPNTQTIIGTRESLVHNYTFTSRDGGERSINVQAAKSLVSLMQVIGKNPVLIERMGNDQLFKMVQEIFRLSGSSFILELPDQDGQQQQPGELTQEQLTQVIQGIAQQVQLNSTEIQDLAGATRQILEALGITVPPEQPPAAPVNQVQQVARPPGPGPVA